MQPEKHKLCFKCGESQPLSAFYRHAEASDGRLNKCKECTKTDVSSNRLMRLDYYRAYDRRRGSRQTREDRQRLDKGRLRASRARYEAKYPERKKAGNAVNNAIRDGRLTRPPCCIACGGTPVEAHHASYDKSMWLSVTWLCPSCHGDCHRKYRD